MVLFIECHVNLNHLLVVVGDAVTDDVRLAILGADGEIRIEYTERVSPTGRDLI
jgi:hypothetical protein